MDHRSWKDGRLGLLHFLERQEVRELKAGRGRIGSNFVGFYLVVENI